MNSKKITARDIADLKISALPTRPTAPQAFGGKGYTATEMKEAFDRLPLYIVDRYNELIDDIHGALSEDLLKLRSDVDIIAERLNIEL